MSGLSVAAEKYQNPIVRILYKCVRTRVALKSDGVQSGEYVFELGPKELRRGTQRVPVLAELALIFFNCHILLLSMSQLASTEEVPNRPRSLYLRARESVFA